MSPGNARLKGHAPLTRQSRPPEIATIHQNQSQIDMRVSPVGPRFQYTPIERFGFHELSGLMMLQGLPHRRFRIGGAGLFHHLACLSALQVPSSEEQSDVDAAVFIAGLEIDDVGLME